jgi:hypothetical protein
VPGHGRFGLRNLDEQNALGTETCHGQDVNICHTPKPIRFLQVKTQAARTPCGTATPNHEVSLEY